MANKDRILYLLRYLQQASDNDHPVTTAEIRTELSIKGCPVTAETLRDDIAALKEVGYEITVNEANGLPTTYSYNGSTFDDSELQILIDLVYTSQFISQARGRQLIAKLSAMAGPSHRDELRPGIIMPEPVRASNTNTLRTIQRIQQAVRLNRKIRFQYYQHNLDLQRVPKHDGKWYIISPYVIVLKHERAYLVGWSDEREKVVVFRIDRMGSPVLTKQPRVRQPQTFDVRDYTERIFDMYEGEMETVTLRCRHHMIDRIIDAFGKNVKPFNVTDETFDVNVQVSVANTFFAWVSACVDDMTIVGPPSVQEAYRQMMLRGLEGLPTND